MTDSYKWDDERGVVKNDRQVLQLLRGPATRAFRIKCGKLLTKALNAEKRKTSKRELK